MKIIFLGTPYFALPSLKRLFEACTIPLIITQTDKKAGRGQKIVFSEIKQFALEKNIQIAQPEQIKTDIGLIEKIKNIQPDLMITAAFGQIISQEIIDIPKFGIWNVHASILPRWRGAAPINWAILAGDKKTGITIMKTDKGLDTGDILSIEEIPIERGDNAEILTNKLASLGAELLLKTIKVMPSPVKQDDSLATHAPKLKKEFGLINWHEWTAKDIYLRAKALYPWPGTYFINYVNQQEIVKIHEAGYSDSNILRQNEEPYIIGTEDNALLIACKEGILKIFILQAMNKPKMKASEWLRGNKISIF